MTVALVCTRRCMSNLLRCVCEECITMTTENVSAKHTVNDAVHVIAAQCAHPTTVNKLSNHSLPKQ